LTSEGGPTGIILSYHRIAPAALDPWGLRVTSEKFGEQMEVLSRHGSVLSLSDYVERRRQGTARECAFVVTFDDGYVDNWRAALTSLRRFRVPATVFVSTGYTGRPYFWWEALEQVFLRPGRLPPRLSFGHDKLVHQWELAGATDYTMEQYTADYIGCKWRGLPGTRVRLYFEVYEALWAIPHKERLDLVDQIVTWAGSVDSALSEARPMTPEEIAALASDPLVTIGGHGVQHLPLNEVTREAQLAEIAGGQDYLEALLGRPVTTFAYPHGKYDNDTIAILEERGFVCACTTRETVVSPSDDVRLLPRLQVRNWSGDEFAAKVSQWLAA
jgi:peptidoglycan/xylan/chitin deacetylase (PgdA/CDA1 family)